MRRSYKRILFLLVSMPTLLALIFVIWAVVPFTVLDEAEKALQSSEDLKVANSEHIVFYPESSQMNGKGLIFYPGARVDSEAYAPLAKSLSEKGWVVVLVNMPLDLSFFDLDAADAIISHMKEVSAWYMGGHSLGGAMAAEYCRITEYDSVVGLLLLGSYPGENTDLRDSGLSVISISGNEDMVATDLKIKKAAYLLPDWTHQLVLDGANHAGFGWYGDQRGDGIARITRRTQTDLVVSTILSNWQSPVLSSF